MFAVIVAGVVGAACIAGFIGWLVFQFVRVCTRNLVKGGANR